MANPWVTWMGRLTEPLTPSWWWGGHVRRDLDLLKQQGTATVKFDKHECRVPALGWQNQRPDLWGMSEGDLTEGFISLERGKLRGNLITVLQRGHTVSSQGATWRRQRAIYTRKGFIPYKKESFCSRTIIHWNNLRVGSLLSPHLWRFSRCDWSRQGCWMMPSWLPFPWGAELDYLLRSFPFCDFVTLWRVYFCGSWWEISVGFSSVLEISPPHTKSRFANNLEALLLQRQVAANSWCFQNLVAAHHLVDTSSFFSTALYCSFFSTVCSVLLWF